ncbi:MAG: Molybdopterin oxidoreductase subunitprotein [Myxococcaceae bacterium]|nr:Molybdopterin oxidoreductase subunitprotein [Myxococcaceae bacterium]
MQIFPRSLNRLPAIVAVVVALAGGLVTSLVWYYFSPLHTQVGYQPHQPVPYSHLLHAGQMGMDCRYCHANIERAAHAMIPPTQTCMNCHSLVRTTSARLAPVRESWASGEAIEWVKVHRLPDHAYFDHSVHLSAGVGCVECHGRVDRMDVVRQSQPLSMSWCLDCHRNPTPHIRPIDQITNMDPSLSGTAQPPRTLNPPQTCSGCHR